MSLDFTSSLFLGLRHAHAELAAWACLTTGRPPMLDPGSDRSLAADAARLLGTEEALLRRSALHGLFDTVTALAGRGTIVLDEAAYPISHWAAAAATSRGATVRNYRHFDAADAEAHCLRARGPVVLVTDGWCSSCGRPTPLADLLTIGRRHRAHVVVDDSLAVGVLGDRRGSTSPFGFGGRGLPAWLGVQAPGPVVVSSLAKAFGAPLAVVGGPGHPLASIQRQSGTTAHASGPTAADRAALRSVLDADPQALDARRYHLARLTTDLRRRLRRRGFRPLGLPFPFVLAQPQMDVVALASRLRGRGCQALVLRPRCRTGASGPILGFALRVDHTSRDLARLEDLLVVAAAEDLRTA